MIVKIVKSNVKAPWAAWHPASGRGGCAAAPPKGRWAHSGPVKLLWRTGATWGRRPSEMPPKGPKGGRSFLVTVIKNPQIQVNSAVTQPRTAASFLCLRRARPGLPQGRDQARAPQPAAGAPGPGATGRAHQTPTCTWLHQVLDLLLRDSNHSEGQGHVWRPR